MTSNSKITEEYISGDSGLRIFVRSWLPETSPEAIIAICHGVNSHSGQYFWAADQLIAENYAVYALDLRGRGKSDGQRFFVEAVGDYVSDLSRLIDLAVSRHPDLPVFLIGHSAGGVVSATYTLENQDKLAGFICESFAFQVPAPGFALAAIKGLSHIAPHLGVLRLKNEDFSRDPEIVASMNADALIANEVQPTSTVAALVRADERLREDFPLIVLPVFIMHGTADKATVPAGSEFFYETVGSQDRLLRLYEDHAHDLLNDYGRERVMEDITDWIAARLPAARRRFPADTLPERDLVELGS